MPTCNTQRDHGQQQVRKESGLIDSKQCEGARFKVEGSILHRSRLCIVPVRDKAEHLVRTGNESNLDEKIVPSFSNLTSLWCFEGKQFGTHRMIVANLKRTLFEIT